MTTNKKCPSCGACQECGHGGRPTYPAYPVYPTYPVYPYPSTAPVNPWRWNNYPPYYVNCSNTTNGG